MKSINVFALFCPTEFTGEILLGAEADTPDIYQTQREAELEIADVLEQQIREFRAGNRSWDLVGLDWYLVPVTVYEDGFWATETNEGKLTPAALESLKHLFA